MKKLSVSFIFTLFLFNTYAAVADICRVDERTELMSIIFRQIGAQEFTNNDIPNYISDIENYFHPYKDEPVLDYVRDLRENFGVAYDAVMSMAINLKIENNKIGLRDDVSINTIDSRWQHDSIPKFIALLNEFYQKTDFHKFFTNHMDLYERSVDNFSNNVLNKINFDWFEEFYGTKAPEKFTVILSLVNGGGSYAARVKKKNGKEELFAIVGSWRTDSLGYPVYGENLTSTVIHEFSHSFCNRLINANINELFPQAEKFNELVKSQMRAMAYGTPHIYLYEILVRACVIKYGEENEKWRSSYVDFELAQERNLGFLWIEDLYKALTNYTQNRNEYPSLESFMPVIVETQNRLNPEEMYKQVIENQPLILGTNIENGAQDIDPNLDEIIVIFNKPMDVQCNGASFGKCKDCEFPKSIGDQWNEETKKEWILTVKLEPNTNYSISFPARFFYSKNGHYSPKETYYLDFKTK